MDQERALAGGQVREVETAISGDGGSSQLGRESREGKALLARLAACLKVRGQVEPGQLHAVVKRVVAVPGELRKRGTRFLKRLLVVQLAFGLLEELRGRGAETGQSGPIAERGESAREMDLRGLPVARRNARLSFEDEGLGLPARGGLRAALGLGERLRALTLRVFALAGDPLRAPGALDHDRGARGH